MFEFLLGYFWNMYNEVQQLMSMLTGHKVRIYYLPCSGIYHGVCCCVEYGCIQFNKAPYSTVSLHTFLMEQVYSNFLKWLVSVQSDIQIIGLHKQSWSCFASYKQNLVLASYIQVPYMHIVLSRYSSPLSSRKFGEWSILTLYKSCCLFPLGAKILIRWLFTTVRHALQSSSSSVMHVL